MFQIITHLHLLTHIFHFAHPNLQLQSRETEVLKLQQEGKELEERLKKSEENWVEKEARLEEQAKMLGERVESLAHHNDVLHQEAEKVGTK